MNPECSPNLPALADPPVVRRTRQVFDYMLTYVKTDGSATQKRFAWLMEAFIDEALEEMKDGSPEQTAAFFDELGNLLHWVATGEVSGEQLDQLPEFRSVKAIENAHV